jgi:hypothetical protein
VSEQTNDKRGEAPRVNRMAYIGRLQQNDGFFVDAPGGEWVKAEDARQLEREVTQWRDACHDARGAIPSATRCTACGAKEGEPCRGNCERAMPSSIGDTTASSTMYVNGHFDIREALDKPTRKADLDLARYILKNLCGWNCRDVVSDEERDTEYLADMISAARYGHATQSATGDTTHPLCQSCSVSNNPRNGRCWSCGEKLPSHLNGRSI